MLIGIGYKLIIFAIILVLGWIIGRVVGLIAAKLLTSMGAESAFRKTVVGRVLVKSGYTLASFSSLIIRIIIYIATILLALQSLDVGFISLYVKAFLWYLPKVVGGAIILIVGVIISDWIGELIKKSFSPEQRQAFYMDIFGNLVKVILYFITITLALSTIGIDVTIFYIFAKAIAWGLAIAIGIAVGIVVGWVMKDRVKDWLSA